jgi:uncharacterized protein involved in exopolysaccharide biosynthesis
MQRTEKAPKSLIDLLEDDPKTLSEYGAILKRRRVLFLLPAFVTALAAVLLALSLPANYRSVATILIEDQEIPEDIVGATITSYATRQIEVISQRLLTTKSIESIVEKFEIYGPIDPETPLSPNALAHLFREDMELALVSSEELQSSRSMAGSAVIAFDLSFSSRVPQTAKVVTEELVSLFLNENRRSSSSRTSGVSELLRKSIDEANDELLAREAELARFKELNEGALPELHELNLGVINRAERQLSDAELRMQTLQQRQIELSARLAQMNPSAAVTLPTGETIMNDRERLRALQMDFRRKSAIYEQGHPDLERLEREISRLRETVGDTGTYDQLQDQLRTERDRLSGLRERYAEDHPDIRSAQASIAALESQLATTSRQDFGQDEFADNPAYVMIQTQLRTTELEISSLKKKRVELETQIADYEERIRQAPQVEMKYESLSREYEDAKAKYLDLQGKLRAAEIAGNVDLNITGQRFILIEPPVLPISPSSPNRPVIVLLGFLLACAVGAGCVAIAEIVDKTIHGAKKLTEIVGAPPLAIIPYLDNSADVFQTRIQRAFLLAGLFAVCALCLIYVRYVIPMF